MNDLLQNLYDDHRAIAKLLKLLERETRLVEQGEPANYRLMEDAIHYIINYPDIFHHPHEEIMFRVLRKKAPELDTVIDAIEQEHQEMAKRGNVLHEYVRAIGGGGMIPREKLVSAAREYVQSSFAHMRREEDTVFPSADVLLDTDDWARIASNTTDYDDPLFGPATAQSYTELYAAIMQES